MDHLRTLIPLFLLALACPAAAVEPGAQLPDWYDVALSAPDHARVGETVEVRVMVAARAIPLAGVTLAVEADSIFAAPPGEAGPFALAPGATREVTFRVGCVEEGSRYIGIRFACDPPREGLVKAVEAMRLDPPERDELLRSVETLSPGPRFESARSVMVDVRP